MSKNERTSKRVAKIAARILSNQHISNDLTVVYLHGNKGEGRPFAVKWSDLKALAASALTQAADKSWSEKIVAAATAKPAKVKR